jgi:predicted dehydrogenase
MPGRWRAAPVTGDETCQAGLDGGIPVIRFGLVGVNTSHADAFSRTLNGSATDEPTVEGGRVVAIWGNEGDDARVEELATKHDVPNRVASASDMIGSIDAVLIVDDNGGGETHAALARPFIEAGLPTFIDKPMTTKYRDAAELFELADKIGAPLMSCSALRFAAELESARAELERIGRLSSVISTGPGDWYYYGVHAVELLGAVAGTGAATLHRHSFDQRDVAVISYPDGPTAIVQTLRDASYVFELFAYGENGHLSIEVKDSLAFYSNTIREVVNMAETGKAPLTAAQTLEVLAILRAGEASAETGGVVTV